MNIYIIIYVSQIQLNWSIYNNIYVITIMSLCIIFYKQTWYAEIIKSNDISFSMTHYRSQPRDTSPLTYDHRIMITELQ